LQKYKIINLKLWKIKTNVATNKVAVKGIIKRSLAGKNVNVGAITRVQILAYQ
jgi:hypothetical protein